MQRLRIIAAALTIAIATGLCFVSCTKEEHFLSNKSCRKEVEKALENRLSKNDNALRPFFAVDRENMSLLENSCYLNGDFLTLRELEALEFLYAYMPLSDLTDYPTYYYLENIRSSFSTKETMSWGSSIPELIFRHFVLPIRVNNEDLDYSRIVFLEELKERVENLPMKEAILEVNHWCHEKMTYQPSDARTSSPLASLKTSFGRCGEESTFTVAALRSVGIPARQVYTPRWAHTDDNHAWVEAWADGQWYFMGACEPEPVLNLGWFNAPASRSILMHTKAFGHYDGPEEVMLEGPNYTEINLIDNYASTAKADVVVKREDGTPVDSARVYFMIYNYSEFYPAVSKYTDRKGRTFLSAGKGDILAWAVKDGEWGYSKISFGKDSEVDITISSNHDFSPRNIDIVPPVENVTLPDVSPELREENNRRTAYEDSLRNAYMATFPTPENSRAIAKDLGIKDPAGATYIERSYGNHDTIVAFLREHPDQRALDLLSSLSMKDLRDITMENLLDSYDNTSSILGPRVANEFLSPYKSYFLNVLSDGEKQTLSDPDALIAWTRENIRLDQSPTAWRIPQSPKGVYESRVSFSSSRDVFFVSLARTLGIESRIDPVTGKVQFKRGTSEEWTDVDFDSDKQASSPKGTLVLNYSPTPLLENPQYYSHFSISKIVDGATQLLSFDEGEVDMGGGVDWKNVFKNGALLDTGTYIISMGNRLSDGSVPVTVQLFEIREGETTALDLIIREGTDGVSVIGGFDSESKYIPSETIRSSSANCPSPSSLGKEPVSLLSTTGRGFFVVGVLEIGKEPTNHTLRDLSAAKDALEKWARPIVLLCSSEAELDRLRSEIETSKYGVLPETVSFGVDQDGSIRDQIKKNMSLTRDDLPLFIIADTFNKVYFLSQGYTIGLGEQLVGTINKLH